MEKLSDESKWLAGVSYLIWPVSLFIVETKLKRDPFLRFHGYQALFLGICSTVIFLVLGVFLQIIPFFGKLLFHTLLYIWAIFLIFLTYRCLQGDFFKIPLIYDLAQGVME